MTRFFSGPDCVHPGSPCLSHRSRGLGGARRDLGTMHLAVLHRGLRANTQALVGPIGSPGEGSSATRIRGVVSDGITFNLQDGEKTMRT